MPVLPLVRQPHRLHLRGEVRVLRVARQLLDKIENALDGNRLDVYTRRHPRERRRTSPCSSDG